MRKRRGYTRRVFRVLRITPAYAGKTKSPAGFVKLHEDHPRVCGKYICTFLLQNSDKGSPPRMREILCFMFDFAAQLGITPAYAGNTVKGIKALREQEDHPRVCGKYLKMLQMLLMIMGSPPRMREILVPRNQAFFKIGITPAYAGNTHINLIGDKAIEDHPRVCGKYQSFQFLMP